MPQGRDRNINEYTTSSNYEVPIDIEYVFADGLSSDIVVTLKRTRDRLVRRHAVQKLDDSVFTVTVTDGTLSYVLSAQGQAVVCEIDSAGNFHVFASNETSSSGGWVIPENASVTYSPVEYADDGSYQPIGPDLNLDPAAGTSDVGDSAYLAPIMGNVIGDLLTKTKNIIAGLIGKFSVTGARASTYPLGGVVGEIGDGVTEADGAVIAVLGGDSAQTNARAAFTVDNQNSVPDSAFEYGLDLRGVDHDGYGLVEYSGADIRFRDGTTQSTAPGGGGVTLETAAPAEGDGIETEFVFVGVPFDVKRNGVSYDPSEFSVLGTTATITIPPPTGKITALTQ